jgi:NADH:ubiquinone oxidoreductase subunit C
LDLSSKLSPFLPYKICCYPFLDSYTKKNNNNKNYQNKKQKNIYSSEMKTQVSPKNSQRLVEKVQNTKIEI